ncbi:maltose O-acyltransferase (MAT)-like acetyltransferase [Campylobacter iguaniorum]|uniref:Maltose O-acyltransferase (MAT)-like acetyltransferase n=1 Tax=Campylobacter iguaniorum TaxID=1244531 RepID=A0A076FDX0_9BACT|nr:acyltransferase [Campylobacter iguaniorum]AII14029.1 maltose O-acyltransferase (MAT)-like acetyltransferase [Campylobacter iguaniorum]
MVLFIKKYFFKQAFLCYSYFLHIMFFIMDMMPFFIRDIFFKFSFKKYGQSVIIDYKTFFRYMNKIQIGNFVSINRGCEFYTSADNGGSIIDIKDHVIFSPNVKIYSAGHDYKYLDLPDTSGDIIIKEHVWIGANSIVLQGVTIGEYSIISANSIVTKDVEPYSIVSGIPARVRKQRVLYG